MSDFKWNLISEVGNPQIDINEFDKTAIRRECIDFYEKHMPGSISRRDSGDTEWFNECIDKAVEKRIRKQYLVCAHPNNKSSEERIIILFYYPLEDGWGDERFLKKYPVYAWAEMPQIINDPHFINPDWVRKKEQVNKLRERLKKLEEEIAQYE